MTSEEGSVSESPAGSYESDLYPTPNELDERNCKNLEKYRETVKIRVTKASLVCQQIINEIFETFPRSPHKWNFRMTRMMATDFPQDLTFSEKKLVLQHHHKKLLASKYYARFVYSFQIADDPPETYQEWSNTVLEWSRNPFPSNTCEKCILL